MKPNIFGLIGPGFLNQVPLNFLALYIRSILKSLNFFGPGC